MKIHLFFLQCALAVLSLYSYIERQKWLRHTMLWVNHGLNYRSSPYTYSVEMEQCNCKSFTKAKYVHWKVNSVAAAVFMNECRANLSPLQLPTTPHLCIAVSFSMQCAVISVPVFFPTCGSLALDRLFDTWEMSHQQINLMRLMRPKFKCVQCRMPLLTLILPQWEGLATMRRCDSNENKNSYYHFSHSLRLRSDVLRFSGDWLFGFPFVWRSDK